MKVLLRETKKGRDVELFVNEQKRVAIRRLSDEVEFHSKISPIDLAAYLLSCLVDRAGQRVVDKEAVYMFHGKEEPALFFVRPTMKGGGIEGIFGFRSVPAIIRCQNYSPPNLISFDVVITAMDIMHIVSMVSSLPVPDWNLVAGSLFITKEGNRLLIRSGGSEPVELTEEARRLLVHRLARYLSGQFLARDDIDQERRYSPSFFSANGCLFNGREDAIIRVHNITTPLAFSDVAAVYLILHGMRGRSEPEAEASEGAEV